VIRPTRFDKEMFQHYRLYIPQEDADEIRASELLANHERRISLQRSVMADRVFPDMGAREVPIVDPHTRKTIGQALVGVKDGVMYVEQALLNGEGAALLGLNLKMISFAPSALQQVNPEPYIEATNHAAQTLSDMINKTSTEQEA
jgi:hypothetical protein